MSAALIVGRKPDGKQLFAAVDPTVRFTQPGTADFRFAAMLTPYTNRDDACAALVAAGAEVMAA